MRIFLVISIIAVCVYLAPAAWYLLNIAMRNEAFADGFVLSSGAMVLWNTWRVVNGRWLR